MRAMLLIYDYACPKCGLKEERYCKNKDIQLCWKCGCEMKQLNTMVKGNSADKARTK